MFNTILQQGTRTPGGRPASASSTSAVLPCDDVAARLSELAAANAHLRVKADRAGSILDSATEFAIVVLDLGGKITGWSKGAELLLGYTGTEAIGRSGALVFAAEDRAAGVFIEELWRTFEHGSSRNERWHVRRDGTRFWASCAMMSLLDEEGMVCGFLNILHDGTGIGAG